jgi:hypothetical protein
VLGVGVLNGLAVGAAYDQLYRDGRIATTSACRS